MPDTRYELRSRFEERELRVLAAVFGRDKATLSELMHPDGFGFDATMGLVRQRDLIDALDALDHGAGFMVDELRVVPAGGNVAALTYRLRQWGEFDGKPLPGVVYCSSVWRLEQGSWQAVFHHETPRAPGDSEQGEST
ncbi:MULTISPECIES: nuclear transport factor 2 family protein [unclassified Nocardia]|uniref:nuclear transport factor 2 family protein n=1 Tax=unclassified Nocardia TaxID=2637762 RepID=UPI003449862E